MARDEQRFVGEPGDPAPLPGRVGLAASLILLVAINVVVIAVALWQRWPLLVLLWPYWLQSVIIGWYSRKRILSLQQFSTEGTSGFEGEPGEDPRASTAHFFVMHYGLFHFGYFFFLCLFTAGAGAAKGIPGYDVTEVDLAIMVALGLSFILVHRGTYRHIIAADQLRIPNIGSVMFFPYLRVVPMHLTILIGLSMQGSAGAVVLFGTLKTIVDLLMHWIEYRISSPTVKSTA